MVPAWSLVVVLLVGGVAGWLLRSWLGRRPAAPRSPDVVEAVAAAPTEPEQKMDAVLTELERRYQGRRAEPESAKPRVSRRRQPPKS